MCVLKRAVSVCPPPPQKKKNKTKKKHVQTHGYENKCILSAKTTLIESSNPSVLKIRYLENCIFLTNEIFSAKYTGTLLSIFHVYS